MRNTPLHTKGYLREWAIIGLFSCLTVLMLYPLSIHLSTMVPEPTDPLLNAWRMQWNTRAFLSGPSGIANLFNTNIFYPFPLTLAYSEHFLMISAQALPFLVLADSHLFGMNLSVLVTFVLSGYGMYLLLTEWTGRRWAGLVAGVLFAYSPQRFGQLNHLELLVTQWMPLTLLALHWTLTRRGWRYSTLFILFFNLQALSGFHFSFNLAIACVLLALVYMITKRVYWRGGLWVAAGVSILVTLLFNWPIWRMYLRFSDVMGAIRTPGEVRIYSAALTDYATTIPHNLLYGWTFNHWQLENHQTQPLMPVGIVGFLLAAVGLVSLFKKKHSLQSSAKSKGDSSNTQHVTRNAFSSTYTNPVIIFLFLLAAISLLLSFGLNENALGSTLAPVLKYSPYFWLYDNVLFFQGIRVPGRFGILVVVGLTGLAGWGVAQLPTFGKSKIQNLKSKIVIVGLIALILLEFWSVGLIGPEFPAGQDIPQVYHWLQDETSPDSVALELPFQGPSEFVYEYYSSHHWRHLANGGTGFTPPIYKELRQWFNNFPDPRSVDIIQQMGIDFVVLHPDSYHPNAWQRVMDELPLYLPAIEQVHQIDEVLVLRIAKPLCQSQADSVNVTLDSTDLDGLPNAMAVKYHNAGPAAFVADVQQPSHLVFSDGTMRNFTEPLVTPAGEVQSVIVPLRDMQNVNDLIEAQLTTLERVVSVENNQAQAPINIDAETQWQPLGLKYADGPQLIAYHLSNETLTPCSLLTVDLQWTNSQPDDWAVVQLLDPFGRIVTQDMTQPWSRPSSLSLSKGALDTHTLPLIGSLPAGKYGLRVLVQTATGDERLPITDEGVTIPSNQIPPLPVIIQPAPRSSTLDNAKTSLAIFGDTIRLLDAKLAESEVGAGDWLRFSLVWQVEQPIDSNLTVFTQLIGPDGQVWGQRDNQPGGGWYGVSLWQPGQPVIDDYAFQIQPDAPPATYRLVAGLYHSDTLERLPVQAGGNFVEIATVQIGK